MAFRAPALTKVTSSTTGTSTYTYVETPTTGYRTISDAVSDGSIASGDTIFYAAEDRTAAGSANLLEVGRGILDTATLTITRVEIYQSSNAGGAVSWGAGTRDIIVFTPIEALALLAAANVFTARQTAHLSGALITPSAYTALLAQNSNSATECWLSLIGAANANVQIMLSDPTTGESAGGRIVYYCGSHATTPHRMDFYTQNQPRFRWNQATSALETAAGLKYVALAAGGSGDKLIFPQSAVPAMFTLDTAAHDKVLRIVNTTGGGTGGSWTVSGLSVSGSTDSYTLTTTDIPAHTHTISALNSGTSGAIQALEYGTHDAASIVSTFQTNSTGSSGGHSHGLSAASIASTGAWRPSYLDAVVGKMT